MPKTYKLIGADGAPFEGDRPGRFGGHTGTRIYGRLDCATALRAIAKGGYVKSRVFFADAATAHAAGYRPCGNCLREDYKAWKAARLTDCSAPRISPRCRAASR